MTTVIPSRRAALYLRQSKSDDEGIARQRDRTRALASSRGWAVAGEFVDDDVSASKERGPETAWGRLLSSSTEIDVVVAVDLDRIARSTRDLNTLIDHGLALVTVDGEIDLASADGELRASVLASVARFEVRRKAERQRRASDQRAMKGKPTARPGYGYRRVDGADVVDDSEAAVIRECARRVLDGESLRAVAADLNARGVPAPAGSGVWQSTTLRQMMRRPSLAGLRTHRGQVVGEFDASLHPAILDRGTHDQLVALFDDPARRAAPMGGPTPKHLLSGLARCGRCGGSMKRLPPWFPKPGQTSKPTKAAYACVECHKVRRLQEPVDELVEEVILRRLERPDAAEVFARGDAGLVAEAQEAIATLDARLATAADQFADGVLTGEQLRRITARLRAERERNEALIVSALPARVPAGLVGARARAAWADLHIDTKRAVIQELARIVILPLGVGRSFDPECVQIEWLVGSERGPE